MSIITVAEYIETEEIGDRVAELGVDYGQGFAIGKPLPLTDLLAELPLEEAAVAVSTAARDAGDAAAVATAAAPAAASLAALAAEDDAGSEAADAADDVPEVRSTPETAGDAGIGAAARFSEPESHADTDIRVLTAFEESDPDSVTCESVVLESPADDSGASDDLTGDEGLSDDETTHAEAEILNALDQVAEHDATAARFAHEAGLAAERAAPAAAVSPVNTDDASTDVQPELMVWYAGVKP
jgi:hypothetical protein